MWSLVPTSDGNDSQPWSGFWVQLLLNLRCTVQELSLPGVLAGNFESFHSSVESESCRISCTIKGPSDPEQFSCAQVSEATQPITKTWLMDWLLVSMFVQLVISLYPWTNHLIFVCSEPCTRNTWCQDKFFPLIASIWGQGGPGQLGHIGSPPNMPNNY